jgi:hypothetical protein
VGTASWCSMGNAMTFPSLENLHGIERLSAIKAWLLALRAPARSKTMTITVGRGGASGAATLSASGGGGGGYSSGGDT